MKQYSPFWFSGPEPPMIAAPRSSLYEVSANLIYVNVSEVFGDRWQRLDLERACAAPVQPVAEMGC